MKSINPNNPFGDSHTHHVLSVLVQNRPGVLARVSGLFARRGFNIESLAVGGTESPDVSRMTIVVNVEDLPLEQVTKQLNKLINVLKIVELEHVGSVERQLILVKVRADQDVRSQVIEIAELFKCKVVDVAPDAIALASVATRSACAGSRSPALSSTSARGWPGSESVTGGCPPARPRPARRPRRPAGSGRGRRRSGSARP